MQDKTILVTGATSGIGKATSIALAKKGAHIIFNTRDEQKGIETQREIQEQSDNANVEVLSCDLSSLKEVNTFAEKIQQQYSKIDVLINNAGVFPTSPKTSHDGFEMGWAVNYLAGFLLTNKLMPQINEAPQGRILFVSSIVHTSGNIDLDDLERKNRTFRTLPYYADSKLAQVLMMKELADRQSNTSTTVNALHPGIIGSNIARDLPWPLPKLAPLVLNNTQKGARTSVYLASNPKAGNMNGYYFVNKKIKKHSSIADDIDFRNTFWELSKNQIHAAGIQI